MRLAAMLCLTASACSGDGPDAGSDPPSGGASTMPAGGASTAPDSTAATGTTEVPRRGVCDTLRARDLAAWFAWPVSGEVTAASPAECSVRLRGGFRASIVSGTADALAERLDELATSSYQLSQFDPAAPGTGDVSYQRGRSVGLATDGTEIVVVDVSGRASVVPPLPRPGTASFLLERMHPVDVDARAAALDSIEPTTQRRCWNLSGATADDAVAAEFAPSSIDFTASARQRRTIEVGEGLIGQITFGRRNPDASCAGTPSGNRTTSSSWPIVAGRARIVVRPAIRPHECLDVTMQLSGLVVERPDDGRHPLPDLVVRNRGFGSGIYEGCAYPTPG